MGQFVKQRLVVLWINEFATSWVPVAPRYLESDLSGLVAGFEQRGERQAGEFAEATLAMNRLSALYRNHLDFDGSSRINNLDTVVQRLASEYEQHEDPGQFLANVYSMAISTLADRHPEEPAAVEAWLDTIEDRAHQTATADTHNAQPGQFLANVYSLAISKLAERHPEGPAAVEAWLDTIQDRAHQTATADTHEEPPGRFITTTLAMALGRVLEQPQPAPRHWYPHMVRDAVTMVDVDTLPQFCRAHERILSQHGRPFPEMHVRLAATTLAVATDDWPGDDHEERVACVATVLATTVHLTWQETRLDGEHFAALVDAVEAIEDEDPDLYADLIEAVPERLDVNHDSLIAGLDWEEAFR